MGRYDLSCLPENALPTFRTTSPGVRSVHSHAGAIFMRDRNPNSTENNRGKQGISVHTYAKRLLGAGSQPPEKRRYWRPFLLPLTGRLRVLRTLTTIGGRPSFPAGKAPPYSALARACSSSTCGAFARQRKRPLPGDWGRPPTSEFSEKIASAYALVLLATIKNGLRERYALCQ